MSNLTVVEQFGQTVVDSRLIAEELGIEHPSFIRTIRKYAEELLSFGRVGFEIAPFETPGGMQQVVFCYLNEEQATFLMTLSRNTPQVVKCKKDLVKAFSQAKALISQRERTQLLALMDGYEEARKEISELKKEVSELRSAILSLAGSDRKFKRRLESVGFTPSLTEEVMEEIARRVERKYKGKEVSWTNLRTYGRSSSLHRTLRKKELNDICDRFGWEWVNSKVSV